MKFVVKIVYILSSIFFLIYLLQPNFDFPPPPPDALQSQEPADTETPLRRAYFTNFSRAEVLEHYTKEFKKQSLLGFRFFVLRLNYPPEEAQTIIRDQTRSTFLEEIVHPFRESLFVNGFEPRDEKDAIFIANKRWKQKIIVRYVVSSVVARIVLGFLIIILLPYVFKNFFSAFYQLFLTLRKKWI